MRILMLGNSFTFTNDMPQMLAELTGAEVVHHTRGGARLSEQLNPNTKLGKRTQAALVEERWDYVVLQEMSHGPVTTPKSFSPVWNGSAGRFGQTERRPFCSPLGLTRKVVPSWRPRAGTMTRWPMLCPQPIKEPLWKTMLCWPMWDSGFMPWPVPGTSMPPTASTPVRWAPASQRKPSQP